MSIADRMHGALARRGGRVTFTQTTGRTYNDATGEYEGGASSTASAPAIEAEGDADRFAALELKLVNPVTLLVDGADLEVPPASGQTMQWAGVTYTVKDVQPTTLDGSPIAWRVTGST